MEQFVNIEENLEEIKSYLPHYVFYRRGYKSPDFGLFGEVFESEKNSKTTDCYCTACHQRYEDTVNPPSKPINSYTLKTVFFFPKTVDSKNIFKIFSPMKTSIL